MLNQIEFLLEEKSMMALLNVILPKIMPEKWILEKNVFLRPHQGKSDLMESIPKKMRAYSHSSYKVGLVILHDKDSNDCIQLKHEILSLTQEISDCPPCLVRIVCTELESWYLADFEALQNAYPKISAIGKNRNKSKFRNPDTITNAAEELQKLVPEYQKIRGSETIAPYLNVQVSNDTRSKSFYHFVTGLQRFLASHDTP
jgi:hypothetical protein